MNRLFSYLKLPRERFYSSVECFHCKYGAAIIQNRPQDRSHVGRNKPTNAKNEYSDKRCSTIFKYRHLLKHQNQKIKVQTFCCILCIFVWNLVKGRSIIYQQVYEQVHVTWLKFIRNLHQVLSIKDTNVEHFRSSLLYSFLFTRAQIHTYNEERIIIIVKRSTRL